MVLYLSSQKLGEKTEYLREWIKEHNNKILLIYNALDAKGTEKINNNVKDDIFLLEQIGFKIDILDLKKYFDEKDKLEEIINNYSSICVMGGNVFVLRQAMKYSGLDEIIKKFINRDFLYIGYSAGCSVLSKDLDVFRNVDDPIVFYDRNRIIHNGLGLIDYVFIPHYKSNYHKVHLIDEVVAKCKKEKIDYKALTDGEVIIEKIN